jgi:hypothetical protein
LKFHGPSSSGRRLAIALPQLACTLEARDYVRTLGYRSDACGVAKSRRPRCEQPLKTLRLFALLKLRARCCCAVRHRHHRHQTADPCRGPAPPRPRASITHRRVTFETANTKATRTAHRRRRHPRTFTHTFTVCARSTGSISSPRRQHG